MKTGKRICAIAISAMLTLFATGCARLRQNLLEKSPLAAGSHDSRLLTLQERS